MFFNTSEPSSRKSTENKRQGSISLAKAPSPNTAQKGVSGNKRTQDFHLAQLKHIGLFIEVLEHLCKSSTILPRYLPKEHVPLEEIVRSVWNVYDNLMLHHGVKAGSKLWKEFRNYTLRQARGQPLTVLSVITATGNKDRVISKFHNLRPLIFSSQQGCAKAYQVLNSVFYSSRIDVRLPNTKKYSVDSVLYHFKCDPKAVLKYRMWLRKKVQNGTYQLGEVPYGKFPLTIPLTSSSPRGGLNLNTLDEQAFDLFKSELFNPFKNLCEFFKDADLPKYVQSLAERLETRHPNAVPKPIRRLTRVPDSDVKDRIIAIVDCFSQLLAGRVQSMLYQFLKKNLMEYTDVFDHARGANKVLSSDPELTTFTSPGSQYILKCTDLEDWTWKFSREPQVVFMEEVLGKGISDPFTPLILDCVWSTDQVKTGYSSVKAGSGQAMGGKASFVLATVTSITLLQAACDGIFDEFLPDQFRLELERTGNFGYPCAAVFRETGDDITLYDYYNRIESCLGLFGNTTNMSKTVYSTDYPSGEIFRFTEYLSRVSMNNVECSRISIKLCRLAESHYTYVPHLLSHLHERGVGVLNADSFAKVWIKKSGPTKDKCGTPWIDNLKTIMTLSNPTGLPYVTLSELNLISDKFSEEYINTFPIRKCLFLTQEILDKMQRTATDLKSKKTLLQGILTSESRVLFVNEQEVLPLDIFWMEYLERVGNISTNIKKFVYSKSGNPKKPLLSPYILPKFMTKDSLDKTILGLNVKESKEEMEEFVSLLINDSNSVDGSYPSFSDQSARYQNLSSLTVRTVNTKSPSFEELDELIVLQSQQVPSSEVANPGSYLLDPFGFNRYD